MDHVKILKRAFEITRSYRLLWIFGILLALTSSGAGGFRNFQVPGGNNSKWIQPFLQSGDFNLPDDFESLLQSPFVGHFRDVLRDLFSVWVTLCFAVACLLLLLVVVSTIIRYVSETALIRLVDNYEANGEKNRLGQGFRLGWSRSALYIFLIDLMLGILTLIVFLILFALAMSPLLLFLIDNEISYALGVMVTIGLMLLVTLLAILVGVVLYLFINIIRRACILENLGMVASIRRGFILVRQRLGDVIIMGLLIFALGLGYLIVMIPVFLILLVIGVVVGSLPAVTVGVVAGIFMQGATPWILAAVVGLFFMMLVIMLPTLFLNGLVRAFTSSTWTLVYREMVSFESSSLDQPQNSLPSTT